MTYQPEIVQSPAEQPAVDYFTGSSVGPFVDTGVYAMDRQTGRRFGRIYLSRDTVLELASRFEREDPNHENSEYVRGLKDGIKENIGGDLVRTAGDIRRLFDRILGPSVEDPAPDDQESH